MRYGDMVAKTHPDFGAFCHPHGKEKNVVIPAAPNYFAKAQLDFLDHGLENFETIEMKDDFLGLIGARLIENVLKRKER